MAANTHSLLYEPGPSGSFLNNLTLSDTQLAELRAARDAIRGRLVIAFREWEPTLSTESLFAAASSQSLQSVPLKPRFRQQGSLSYHTANQPAWTPPQEVDLDDGLFLPTEMLGEAGKSEPAVLTGGLFTIVENALSDLCQQKGWDLETKDNCVRVRLNHGSAAHVDLPIYAIPEKKYHSLEVAAESLNRRAVKDSDDITMVETAYRQLASGEIMLAHRKEGWIRSDPRKLEDWFNEAVQQHGSQLRRVCRYLKAWRDYTWEDKGPSSIALMACVVATYDSHPKKFQANRDDLALREIASHLHNQFRARIQNPVVPGLYLDEGWDKKGRREEYIEAARTMNSHLNIALDHTTSASQVIGKLRAAFGDRIPNTPGSVRFPAPTTDEWLEKTKPLAPTVKPNDNRSYA